MLEGDLMRLKPMLFMQRTQKQDKGKGREGHISAPFPKVAS